MPKRTDPKLEAKAIALIKSGMNGPSVASLCNLDPTTIYSIARRNKVSLPSREMPETEKRELARMWAAGYSISELRKRFPTLAKGARRRLLDSIGVTTRRPSGTPRTSDAAEQRILSLYNTVNPSTGSIYTQKELSLLIDVNRSTVGNILRRHNRQLREQTDYNRPYSINDRYFHSIDTPDKAYWLGLIATDGCVTGPDETLVQITLELGDADHLQLFSQALGGKLKVRRYPSRKGGPAATVSFSSVRMASDLKRHGIHPRKSLTLEPWSGPDWLMRHYWRGVIDGDGSLNFSRSGNQWGVSLGGTKSMTEAFAKYCKALCATTASVSQHKHRPSFHQFTVRSTSLAAVIVRHLYQRGDTALARKVERARQIVRFARDPLSR